MPPPDLVLPEVPCLWLSPILRPELSLGAFQRAASALRRSSLPVTRRRSGGPALCLGPEALHLALFLPTPSALVPDADLPRLLNRHVRPLLRALKRLGLPASYPGRDWIAVAHRPAVWVGFAHRASSGACCVEAFLPLDLPFALPPGLDAAEGDRSAPPWLGKTPAALRELSPKPLALEDLQDAVVRAYAEDLRVPAEPGRYRPEQLRPEALDGRGPWAARREEAIGFVGAAGPPAPGLGGDFFASEDLISALDARLQALPAGASRGALEAALMAAVEETGGALEGVRSAATLLDVLEEAFATPGLTSSR